jgi:protein-tyrosine kinase
LNPPAPVRITEMQRVREALERSRRGGGFGSVWLAETPHEGHLEAADSLAHLVNPDARPLRAPNGALLEHRIIGPGQRAEVIDAYRMLRTQVLSRMRERGWTTLAVTSAGVGEGKSVTAVNLALSIVMEPGQSAVLVDCDLRNPCLHALFGMTAGPGLSDFLTHGISLARLLIEPGVDGLLLLPGGRCVDNSAELLASHKMQRLVRTLKGRERGGRYIVFDLPATLHYADMIAFAPMVDAVLLVAEEGRTQHEDLVKAGEYLSDCNIIGTVLNKVEAPQRAAPRIEPAIPRGGLFRRRAE